MSDPASPSLTGESPEGGALEPHHSWSWDSGEHEPPVHSDPESVRETPDEAPKPSPEDLPRPFVGTLASADLDDPPDPPAATRPAIAFAEQPLEEEILGTSWPAPLQERILGLTGQHVDIALHDISEPRPDRLPPLELPPRYRWLSTLGEGGQGSVELVLDQDLGRPVALKTLLQHKKGERHLLDLYREARITGQLDHPHIITIYDAGQLPDGRLFYTMPPMPGENLHNVLVRLRKGREDIVRRWGLVPLIQVLVKACHGVGYAHARGVIHLDIKPGNILLGGHGEVLVVDWGIARVIAGPSADTGGQRRLWSREGDARKERVRGSPPYMAPEQVKHPDQVGPAADVFCLGVILYEALTRVPPWTGSDIDSLVDGLCHTPPVPPRERAPTQSIPAELEEICLRALEKFPGHRYQGGTELAEALDEYLAGGRRREAAARRLRQATSRKDRHRSLTTRRRDAERRLDAARAPLGADDAPGPEELRELRAKAESLGRAADGVLAEAVWALRRALTEDPEHPGVRETLAELYADRYVEAERLGNEREVAWFRALLRQFEDGRWGRWLRTGAELTVAAVPESTTLNVLRVEERDGALLPGEALAPEPDGRWQLAPGRYALLPDDGEPPEDWYFPIRLDREDRRHLVVELTGREAAGDEFCFIPGGTVIVGGDRNASGSGRRRRIQTGPFALARFPVTVGAYGRFLAWVGDDRPGVARRHRPADFDAQLKAGERRPVRNVCADDADAYCRWLSDATGRTIRLPTADEWEKAARGGDGRAFPWGDRFGPERCAGLGAGVPGGPPPAVGLYAKDRSPFGVRDLAGGVWEWTETPTGGRRVVCGGSIVSEETGCRAATRRALMTSDRLGFLGFRVLMEVVESRLP